MKRLCVYLVALSLLLLLTACGEKASISDKANTMLKPTEISGSADALASLRADMKPPVIAVADFGFPEWSADFNVMDYLLEEYPKLMAEHDFIGKISPDRIVSTAGSDDAWVQLLCIVPQDPQAAVCVKVTQRDPETFQELGTENVYSSEKGEPILLVADISEETTVTVVVIDSTGRGVSWQPYWGNYEPIPEDGYYGALVMDFTPMSEKTAYDRALANGWFPPESTMLDGLWQSDYGYMLELCYEPDQVYDGYVTLYKDDGYGEFRGEYVGNWRYCEGKLHLHLESTKDLSVVVEGDFPILTDPWMENWLGIGRSTDGTALPYFFEELEFDELYPANDHKKDLYEYMLGEGWRVPELWELMNTGWLSVGNYAMDLSEDGATGDNWGWVTICDVDEIGAYTCSYTGAWQYENGRLYLSLIPEFSDGYLVDDSFPVLMLDGYLWIGRNENGIGLPHFYSDQESDVLEQPKG
jgi:hypothetical protein